jgi:hypothetical protein
MKNDVSYLTAKLEEMHEDIKQLNAHVDILRQESAGRGAVHKFILGSMGVLATLIGWILSNLLPV